MLSPFRQFTARYLMADAAPLSTGERRRSVLAAFFGMLLIEAVLLVLPVAPEHRHLLAPLGATSVILFALPHSPLGQPWSTAGGLLLSAGVGWACGQGISPPWLAVPVALALAIWLMAGLRCLHPPGGALAVGFALLPGVPVNALNTVFFNVGAALIAALAINSLLPGRRWPQCAAATPPATAPRMQALRSGVAHVDLQHALSRIDSYLDISEDDLLQVYDLATEHAFERHERRTCSELMTTGGPTVEFATELNEAWRLLRQPQVTALPVLNRARQVIGLISADDFLRHVPPDSGQRLGDNVRKLLRPSSTPYADKPEVVGQIMSGEVLVAHSTDSLGQLAARLVRCPQPPAIPVVGPDRKLLGLLRQDDLLAALYQQQAARTAQQAA